ncbi:hypothetical protein D3C86_1403220 [compost metagenome]
MDLIAYIWQDLAFRGGAVGVDRIVSPAKAKRPAFVTSRPDTLGVGFAIYQRILRYRRIGDQDHVGFQPRHVVTIFGDVRAAHQHSTGWEVWLVAVPQLVHGFFVLSEPEAVVLVHYVELGQLQYIQLTGFVVLEDHDVQRVDLELPVDTVVLKPWDNCQYRCIHIELMTEGGFGQFFLQRRALAFTGTSYHGQFLRAVTGVHYLPRR